MTKSFSGCVPTTWQDLFANRVATYLARKISNEYRIKKC